jgi:hypothetical protein
VAEIDDSRKCESQFFEQYDVMKENTFKLNQTNQNQSLKFRITPRKKTLQLPNNRLNELEIMNALFTKSHFLTLSVSPMKTALLHKSKSNILVKIFVVLNTYR